MRLARAEAGQVVRNLRNGSFYRFEQREGERCRIRPLELFPNGLLIPKTAPTIVEGVLEVESIGAWHDQMVVEGKPTKSRQKYEQELAERRVEWEALKTRYDELPVDGVGKLSRGSHANKLKACQERIIAIERGLSDRPVVNLDKLSLVVDRGMRQVQRAQEATFKPKHGGLVQLPSGLPALVTGNFGNKGCTVRTRFEGVAFEAAVPHEVLRPWASAHMGTV